MKRYFIVSCVIDKGGFAELSMCCDGFPSRDKLRNDFDESFKTSVVVPIMILELTALDYNDYNSHKNAPLR